MSEGKEESLPSGDELRAVMRHFATGVGVLTTRHEGVDHASTVNSLTSVSLDPPLVLVCIGAGSRMAAPLRESRVWAVSILPEGRGDAAVGFAGREGAQAALQEGIHRGVTGSPLLDDSLARIECRTYATHPAGDHEIVVGRLVATSVGDASAGSGAESAIIDMRGPLVSFRGAFGTTV